MRFVKKVLIPCVRHSFAVYIYTDPILVLLIDKYLLDDDALLAGGRDEFGGRDARIWDRAVERDRFV